MSVQNEIDRINNNISNTYATLNEAGATMPVTRNSNNLSATAASISAVLFNKAQNLTEAQQQQARDNIGVEAVEGPQGPRGTGILKVTTAPSSYTTATGGFTPTYRISLSTVKTQAKVSNVIAGDIIQYSYYLYPVGYVDSSYVYTGARTSIRGETGAAGADGNGILSVVQTTTSNEDGGQNILTITEDDGTTNTFIVRNGSKGSTGETGPQGPAGPAGPAGADGGSILEEVGKTVITNNLNDEVYEYGYFNSSGQETELSPITWSFRTANYIPVEGGKTITWNADRSNSEMQNNIRRVVEYDEGKNFVKYTDSLQIALNKWDKNKGLTLQANTKYVRFTVYKSTNNEIDLSAVKLNLFYVENIAEFWTGAGDTFNHVPHFKIESAGEFVPLAKIQSPLTGKKIIYDGDSIAESRLSYAVNGGGYAKLIADAVGGTYQNFAVGGARLTTKPSDKTYHSVVDNIVNLPVNGDLYCFEGGINDYWTPKTLGTFSKTDFTGALDKNTICGALETIFRYALSNFVGKPICFVITHKIQSTAYAKNANNDTFEDYRNAMVGICQKYSIPYYDAFSESGLNGWNTEQNNAYLTANTDGTADGTHPNEEGYKRYYVPQLISLFERIMPR